MPTRIPASERTSQKLDELLTQGVADGDARAELLKLAVRKIVEEALEAEVADAVGRGYYENGAPPGAGYRNGYRRGRLASAEGPIEYGVPQVADRVEPFVSRVRAGLAGRTAELERLAVEMFARGLSTRDIEAAFRDASGASVLSRTAVSQVTERLWQEYEAFAGRDLSEFSVAYLFVDGVAERLHAGLPREAVLCAWGITDDGQKVLLAVVGNAPGTEHCFPRQAGMQPLRHPVDEQVGDREFAEVSPGEGFVLLPEPLGHLADRRATQHAGPARIPKRRFDVPRAQPAREHLHR